MEEGVVVARAPGCIVDVAADKGITSLRDMPPGIREAETGLVRDEHDVERLEVPVRQDNRREARLLMALRPDNHSVVVSEVMKEGKSEYDVVRLIVVPDLLRPVAVGHSNQKLCRRGEELASSIEYADLQFAHTSTSDEKKTSAVTTMLYLPIKVAETRTQTLDIFSQRAPGNKQ